MLSVSSLPGDPGQLLKAADGSATSLDRVTEQAARLAEILAASNVNSVGLRMNNDPRWICADFACHLAGIPVTPIPAFFSPAQAAHVVRESGMDALIGSPAGLETVFKGFEPAPVHDALWFGPRKPGKIPEGIAKVTFTSGTTGAPKGVCLSWDEQVEVAGAIAQSTADAGIRRHLCTLPLQVLLENVAGVYAALKSGADVVIPPLAEVGLSGSSGFEPRKLIDAIRRFRPDSLILLPQMLKSLVAVLSASRERLDGLRFVAVGGARTSRDLILEARALGLPVYEGYGLSECCSVVTVNLPGKDRPGSAGTPLPGRRLRISDDGEVEVFCPNGVRYLGQPPVSAGWLPTGDLGKLDSRGFLDINGRRKQVLITGFGRNVSPEWVESELLAEPAIAQAVVLGNDLRALAALVSPAAGMDRSSIQAAIKSANARLPDYARIGGWREIRPLSVINGQLTPNGRIRRQQVERDYGDTIAALIEEIEAHHEEQSMNFYQDLLEATRAERNHLLTQPVITECMAGRITLETYRAFLEQAYHHVKFTVPLLMACGARLPERLEWLREAVAEYIEEETGHQEWILNDIEACGGDAGRIRNGTPGMATDVMVAYAWDCVLRRNPVSFFGMVLVLEGTSVRLATDAAAIIQQKLALPDRAFSYLRSHGSLDVEHLGFYERLMNRLEDPADRAAVLDTARVMYRLYANVFAELPSAASAREAA